MPERASRARSRDAVGDEPRALLEGEEGLIGVRAVQAVDRAEIGPGSPQRDLKGGGIGIADDRGARRAGTSAVSAPNVQIAASARIVVSFGRRP